MSLSNAFSPKLSRRLKRFLRWAIWGGTLFFIVQALVANWPAVREINLTFASWGWLALAGTSALIAHSWAGWVWHWLLQLWGLPLGGFWSTRAYLLTNVAKYLPGNVWHFYGRVRAVQSTGGTLDKAVVSVVAEPLVMAVAALGVGTSASAIDYGLFSAGYTHVNQPPHQLGTQLSAQLGVQLGSEPLWILALFLFWGVTLSCLHPRWLNPVLGSMSRLKMSGFNKIRPKKRAAARPAPLATDPLATDPCANTSFANDPFANDPLVNAPSHAPREHSSLRLKHYPLKPLLGEIVFVLGRSLGFMLTMRALTPISVADCPTLVAAFSLAWLLGLVVPGAPGGIGVFEASAIALLSGQFPPALILASVACYRLVSTLAEGAGATLSWLYDRFPID